MESQPDISRILAQLEANGGFNAEKSTHESPLLGHWLHEHEQQILDGYAQMAAVIQDHPELAHADVRATDADFIRDQFPVLVEQFEDKTGLRWDIAQGVLSITGPTAYAGLTRHQDIAGEVGVMYTNMVAQLDEVGKGLWLGPHNLMGRTPQELENRGYPFSIIGSTGSNIISGVHQMGFLPQSSSEQPVLEARLIM